MTDLTLVYFAWVREAIGRDEERVELSSPEESVGELVARLAVRGGGYAEALADPDRLRAALDQQFVGFDTAIGRARELALFPPVTGG